MNLIRTLMPSSTTQTRPVAQCRVLRPQSRTLDETDVQTSVSMLKALAHPVRLRMVDLIHKEGGEICVCEFERYFDLRQPTISHHLKILRDVGLIRSQQEGPWVRRSIEPDAFSRLEALMAVFSSSS